MGTGYPGGTYRQLFYFADVEAAGPAIDGELHVDLDACSARSSRTVPISRVRPFAASGNTARKSASEPVYLFNLDLEIVDDPPADVLELEAIRKLMSGN